MIQSVKIERLRGIREGELNDLTPLTILVGGNGSGKSTVLEALYIAGSANPPNAIGECVLRRADIPRSWRWLLYKGGRGGEAEIEVGPPQFHKMRFQIGLPTQPSDSLTFSLHEIYNNGHNNSRAYKTPIKFLRQNDKPEIELQVFQTPFENPLKQNAILLEPIHSPAPQKQDLNKTLCDLHSKAEGLNASETVDALLCDVIPNMVRLQLHTEPDFIPPILHVRLKDQSVPAVFIGDGIVSVIHIALSIATQDAKLVLIEEPEVHQHYRTMSLIAKVIWAAIRREIQVILTTHSLEFIDAIIDERPTDIPEEKLSLVYTSLAKGKLITTSYSGEEVVFTRKRIEGELR